MDTLIQFRTQLKELLESADNILITSHMQPDDDSIASVLALYFILSETYSHKKITMRYSGIKPERWQYFANFDAIEFVPDIAETDLHNFDVIFFLDSNTYWRFSHKPDVLSALPAKKVCLDHHASPADAFDLIISQRAPATTSLIYQLFINDENHVPKRLAELFVLGIWGDTGGLRYVELNDSWLYTTMEKLISAMDQPMYHFEAHYSGYSEAVATALRAMVANQRVETASSWPPFTVSYIDRDFVKKHNFSDETISQAYKIYSAHHTTAITTTPWGFVLYPLSNGSVGISMRSRPDGVNVRHITESLGVGGGHDFASGGIFRPNNDAPREPHESLKLVLDWLDKNPYLSDKRLD